MKVKKKHVILKKSRNEGCEDGRKTLCRENDLANTGWKRGWKGLENTRAEFLEIKVKAKKKKKKT